MKYYYFAHNTIVDFSQPTKDFEELTSNEKNFYLACKDENYNPSIQEIKNLKKRETLLDLDLYKKSKINDLSNISFSESERVFPSHRHKDAILKVYKNSLGLLDNESEMVSLLRKEFYKLKYKILNAETKEDVNSFFLSNEFKKIADSYNFEIIEHE